MASRSFSETEAFTRLIPEHFASEEDYAEFQWSLLRQPDLGAIVPGTGGARKMRYPDAIHNLGVRGGLRVIYFWFEDYNALVCVLVYSKLRKKDLTKAEERILSTLSDELRVGFAERAAAKPSFSRKERR